MIHYVEETGSTNADLASRLKAGAFVPEGEWLVADRQTAGRGRLGRHWFDGSGNFMGSCLVRWSEGQPPPATLALVVGLAVYEAVAPLLSGHALAGQGDLRLKWPNDLLLDGAKLSGILLEMVAGVVIVGIGVNLRHAPVIGGRETVALSDIGVAVPRDVFAERLAATLDRELARWRGAGLAPMLRRWQSAAHPEGTALVVHPPGEGPVQGTFAGLSDDGNLRLETSDGTVRLIHAGDVFLRSNAG
ncbi:biotin--[acetyl-CoA-carboxylase] ligase [Novosphingobium sp. 1949]|uniref:biotin--[biotin carboxyl-carrier protein] ligase n=1 Tax=Novosphingobium organovorum TaxID=2930092 RepID=A0ABT0B894_9SPHN|nr:biotin--[acetyl-CoA-carboxylase] ligase [Novosphingobium organovorum]MCJ2181134.1 biotin--[acetyl-CoA-carboxylase] ligase [Novosphingobium organovorum]